MFRVRVCDIENFQNSFLMNKQYSERVSIVRIEFKWISQKFIIYVAAYENTQRGRVYEGWKFDKHFSAYRKLMFRVGIRNIKNFHYSSLVIKLHSESSLLIRIEFKWISRKFIIYVDAYENTQCGLVYEGWKFDKHFYAYRKLVFRVRVCDIENFHYSFLMIKLHSKLLLLIRIEFKWISQKFIIYVAAYVNTARSSIWRLKIRQALFCISKIDVPGKSMWHRKFSLFISND